MAIRLLVLTELTKSKMSPYFFTFLIDAYSLVRCQELKGK